MPIASFKSHAAKAAFQEALDAALILLTIIGAFSVLILGIFACNFDAPGVLNAAMAVVCGLAAAFSALLIARLICRAVATRIVQPRPPKAMIVLLIVYCVVTLGLAFGTVHLAMTAITAPTYDEANTTTPTPFPAL